MLEFDLVNNFREYIGNDCFGYLYVLVVRVGSYGLLGKYLWLVDIYIYRE